MTAGRQIDAALLLIDRQVVDTEGINVCNVDDLELTVPEGGGAPYVSAILAGPAALGPRFGGLLCRWFVAIQKRLHPAENPEPGRIDFGVVAEVADTVRVSLHAEQLEITTFEDWTRVHVIGKIPGAHHASE